MGIREEKQNIAADLIVKNKNGIINAAPRFGKILVTLKAFQQIKPEKVLIIYPNKDIKTSWENDIKKWESNCNFYFITTASLKKEVEKKENYDYIVADEIHEYSANELRSLKIVMNNIPTIGLSGTMTYKSINRIREIVGLNIIYKYPIEEAIADGVLCDYSIIVHTVSMEKQEQNYFNKLKNYKNKLEDEEKSSFFIDLKMIACIQKSEAKRKKTIELLSKNQDKRILVFTGLSEIADNLGIPSYHSKNRNKELFNDFCNGIGKHLATIRMADAGITIKPINFGIINYISGNPENSAQKICRFLGIEWENKEKQADIHIVTTTNTFELDRLQTALMFFDNDKITYLNN